MPRLAPRAVDTATRALRGHNRRIENLEVRKPLLPAATLPTNPITGQRAILTHATGAWELLWNGSAWAYLGGSDLVGYADAEISTSSTSYPGSPQGPTVTLPRAGTFDVYIEAKHRHGHTAGLFTAMAVMQGASVAGRERAPVLLSGEQVMQSSWPGEQAGIAFAAGAIGIGFRAPNGASILTYYAWRQIRVRPRTLT